METWSRLYDEHHVAESSLELPFISFRRDDLVLDIGCGKGRQMDYLKSKYGCMCMGVDIVPVNRPEIRVADACHLPFGDSMFDVSYSLGVVEHIDTEKAIRESIRVTKSGGCVLHSVPNTYSLHTLIERPLTDLFFRKWSVGPEQPFTPNKIRNIFKDCGLAEIRQRIVGRPEGESEIYKLSRAESLFYQALKQVDNLLFRVVPDWGFFVFTYGIKPHS